MSKILEFKPKPPPPSMVNVIGFQDGKMTINGVLLDMGSSGYTGDFYRWEPEPPEAG
jgi:hypothetical protein